MIDMPWAPNTRQVAGRVSEKRAAKEAGARLHPNSGAGRIKYDYSDADAIFEHKDATLTHALNAKFLLGFFRAASRQGTRAVYVVQFANGIKLTGYVERNVMEEEKW